jgi:hypothetical protein
MEQEAHQHAIKVRQMAASESNNGYSTLDEPRSGNDGRNSLEIEMQPLQL